jgi:mannitol-specific phosphotransferase system IIBC component
VDLIIVACEAGMGSSLMCVSALRKKLKSARVEVKVAHMAVHALPVDAEVVVVHRGLVAATRRRAPGAVVIGFSHFLNDPVLDSIVQSLASGAALTETE